MQVASDKLGKWPNELLEKVIDKDGIEHILWLFLALIYDMQYINNNKYLSGDIPLKTERLKKSTLKNVQFFHGRSLSYQKTASSSKVFSLHAERNVALDKELLVYCGDEYDIYGWSRP